MIGLLRRVSGMRSPRPDSPDHEVLDLRSSRRLFVFGDVHGRLDLLRDQMERVGFEPDAGDVAVGCGDWMDRGPAGLVEMREFLTTNLSVGWVRGNHEALLWDASHDDGNMARRKAWDILANHGGDWLFDHVESERVPDAEAVAFAEMLNDAPVAYTVLTPGGACVGIVHAGVPAPTWQEMVDALEGPDPRRAETAIRCMWDRSIADEALSMHKDRVTDRGFLIPGVDHVFCGHTKVGRSPITHANQTWIDTGAYRTDVLTFVNADQWIADRR